MFISQFNWLGFYECKTYLGKATFSLNKWVSKLGEAFDKIVSVEVTAALRSLFFSVNLWNCKALLCYYFAHFPNF